MILSFKDDARKGILQGFFAMVTLSNSVRKNVLNFTNAKH